MYYVQTIDRDEEKVGIHEDLANGSSSLDVSFDDLAEHWKWADNGNPCACAESWHIFDVAFRPMVRR